MKKLLIALCYCTLTCPALAQDQPVQGFVHEQSRGTDYIWPTDPQVLEKLDQWQDLKFGVLFHWGLYSVPGIVESWSICSEDVDWITRKEPLPYDEYKKWYFGLQEKLVPTQFNPEQWADVMEKTGMKYMIFTSKHHDGFCLYDSQYTDFSIAKGPFRDNPRADAARYVWDAFRARNFMIGCYFSKPDWHTEWYWNPNYATPNRHQNYLKERHPEWWQNYVTFTQNQLDELMTRYGKFDILWLDGGWVTGKDIDLDGVLKKAREKQPGLIAVNRANHDQNENYQTPERGIPETQLDYPWESCLPLSWDWGWVPDAPYKSARWIINTLAEITAKGGCFLLGVGPTAQGKIEDREVQILEKAGLWLKANGRAIYGTRNAKIYHDGNTWFTADKDQKTLYAIYALPEKETLPATITWHGNLPKGKMKLLGTGKTVKYTVKGDQVTVTLPKGTPQESLALMFQVKP